MIHGQKDNVVPVIFSRYILKLFTKADKNMLIIINGDHSLSNRGQLKKIFKELNVLIKHIA